MRFLYLTILASFISFSSFAIGPITGTTTLCYGDTTTLSDATPGGTWSSSNTVIASIDVATGHVTTIGIYAGGGTAIITYGISGSSVTTTVTVNPLPTTYAITGGGTYCSGGGGDTIKLSGSDVGVNYQLYVGAIPVLSAITGTGTILNFGAQTIAGSYVVIASNATTHCTNTMSGSPSVTINPAPASYTSTGGGVYCSGGGGVNYYLGGSSTGVSYQLYGPGGVVGAPIAGLGIPISFDSIIAAGTYSVLATNMTTGCSAWMTDSVVVFVNPALAPISGITTVCGGSTAQLSDATAGGVWSQSNPSIATVNGSGLVTGGVVPAMSTTVITYSVSTGYGCVASTTVTVNPGALPITGPTAVCAGFTITLSDATAGGTWSCSNSSIATITLGPGASGGILTTTPISGTASTLVVYTLPSGCTASATVTINPSPGSITGLSPICVGNSETLSDATPGGTWMSSSVVIATVMATTAVVYGVSSGTAMITYTIGTGCSSTTTLAVNPTPSPITGPSTVCVGNGTTLGDITPGGVWSSSTPSIAAISTGGVVIGNAAGTTIITYSLGIGCIATTTLAVNPSPSSIIGPSTICAGGGTATLSDATLGGTWSSSVSSVATVGAVSGIVTGGAVATTLMTAITYSLPTGCVATTTITVDELPGPIYGASPLCVGNSETLSDLTAGGTWSCSSTIATINRTTGITFGVSTGTDIVTYTLIGTGCSTTTTLTVNPSPSSIIGPSTICAGTSVTFSDATLGGTWSGTSAVATVNLATGVVLGVGIGSDVITYSLSGTGCSTTTSITVSATLSITASATQACGGMYTLTAGGGTTYSWSPSTGLSCSTCSTTTINPAASATYTVTGTTGSCSDTASIAVDGNRVSGYISYTGGVSTDSFKVWLTSYNPADSTITGLDSTYSCMDGGTPYYQFTDKPAGSYMVKAEKSGNVPGTSGYIPTYGLSSSVWNTATTVTHSSATDTQHINMIYGTVPAGPGFISGNVYSGAGRAGRAGRTTSVAAVGMLIYLQNTATSVLTYTYTDTGGAYTFSNLAYGSYIIYPEAYSYYTTPSSVITLNAASPSSNAVDFKQHTTYGTITPLTTTAINPQNTNTGLSIFPNPASDNLTIQWQGQSIGNADLVISDMMGREVYKTTLDINAASGQSKLNMTNIKDGVYLVVIKSGNINFSSKLLIAQ